jgi:hypothetical protein
MGKRNKWFTEEIDFLIENYKELGLKNITKYLERHSRYSILRKARNLKLTDSKLKKNYHLDDIKDVIIRVVKDSHSFSEVFRKLNKSKSGDGYNSLRRFIIKNSIDISHFQPWRNNGNNQGKKDITYYLVEGSNISSSHLKQRLYESNLKQRICEKCGQGEDWNGERMSLILDHINGVPNDNRIENLRILCPNCNATLPTHCKGSKGLIKNQISIKDKEGIKKEGIKKEKIKPVTITLFTENQKISQLNQRKVQRPPYETLLLEVKELGFVGTGKKYNVSDNSIRKWIKMYQNHGLDF